MLVANDEAGHGEAVAHDALGIGLWSDEEISEVLVILVVLVLLISPHGNFLPMEDHDVEKGVQEEDGIRAHAERRARESAELEILLHAWECPFQGFWSPTSLSPGERAVEAPEKSSSAKRVES